MPEYSSTTTEKKEKIGKQSLSPDLLAPEHEAADDNVQQVQEYERILDPAGEVNDGSQRKVVGADLEIGRPLGSPGIVDSFPLDGAMAQGETEIVGEDEAADAREASWYGS